MLDALSSPTPATVLVLSNYKVLFHQVKTYSAAPTKLIEPGINYGTKGRKETVKGETREEVVRRMLSPPPDEDRAQGCKRLIT